MTEFPRKEGVPTPNKTEFPLFVTNDNELYMQSILLWMHSKAYNYIQGNSKNIFSEGFDTDEIKTKLESIYEIFGILGIEKRKILNSKPPFKETNQKMGELYKDVIQPKMTAHIDKFGYEKPEIQKMPKLKDRGQLGKFLHDLGNSAANMKKMIEANNERYFNIYFEKYHKDLKRAYANLGQELVPEATLVSIDHLFTTINNAIWAYEEMDGRYFLDYDKDRLRELEDVQFFADIADLDGFVSNILQNMYRSYETRDETLRKNGEDTEDLPRPLGIHFDVITEGEEKNLEVEFVYASFEDRGVGFPDYLLVSQQFVQGTSTFQGQGIGMADYQIRFDQLGIHINLANTDTGGARITVRFRGSRKPFRK